jgi:hypothetical protein
MVSKSRLKTRYRSLAHGATVGFKGLHSPPSSFYQAILLCVKPSHIQIDNLPSLQMTLANNHQAKTFGMLREKEHTTPIIKQQALTMKSNSWHIHYNFKA